ncbi:MlaE family lipid ABC transporter permease subunit [bacterium]|nr:MlaE family lipid ABC transporter permease subunit [bacterium]
MGDATATIDVLSRSGDRAELKVAGRLSADTAGDAWRVMDTITKDGGIRSARIDAAGLTYCDVSGAAVLIALQHRITRGGGSVELTGVSEEIGKILGLFEGADPEIKREKPEPVHLPEQTGKAVHSLWSDLTNQVMFLGQLTAALMALACTPWRIRWRDTFIQMEKVGFDAVPIATLVGFLVGLIIALTAAIPMREFGAEVFVANLVGLAILRELGPLMGAILLAGRSGSAFAAEIGTMKVNDELNALNTMGLDPMRFLVVPRVLAGVTMMPFLTVLVNFAGLMGGLVVCTLWLGFPVSVYVNQLTGQIAIMDIVGGLIKAFVFGIIVSGVGCMRGLQTKSGAAAVGESTTSSVVTTIVLIVVASGIFTYLYAVLGI